MEHLADYLLEKFNNPELTLNKVFTLGKPTPNIVLDNFLPKELALSLNRECNNIPEENWKVFTRKGSHMMECNKLNHMRLARRLIEELNSSQALTWLEQLTGIQGLLPDPHLTGAGYSKSFTGDTLQVHNDFNWNDQLRLHRALSVIIYLTPNWQAEWGGGLEFYDSKQTSIVKKIDCLFNRMLAWSYTPENYHGYTTPLSCPENVSRNTIRLFYYTSNSTHNPNDPPHRSQYWYDPQKGAYDQREQQ